MINYTLKLAYACSQSLRAVKNIPFQEQNLSQLNSILALPASKQVLNSIIATSLKQICPDQNPAKLHFEQAQGQVNQLYKYIKEKILHESDPQLSENFFNKAHYYFMKQGKKIRPIMVAMFAKNYHNILKQQGIVSSIHDKVYLWSALIEMMHIASLAHDDVVDDSPSRRGQESQHIKYGPRTAIFSGNYIISRASKTVAQLQSKRLYQIYANTMNSLAEGEIQQLISKSKYVFANEDPERQQGFDSMLRRYMDKTYYKSAALMSNSMLGVPTLFSEHYGSLKLEKMFQNSFPNLENQTFKIGQHYGLALQLVDDILDYISTAEEMGKQEMSDLVQGNVTAPVYFTFYHKSDIPTTGNNCVNISMLNKKKKNKKEAMLVKEWVESGVGIELTYVLAAKHVLMGLQTLQQMGIKDDELLGWRYLGYKLMTRRK